MIRRIVIGGIALLLLFSLTACALPQPFDGGEVLSADEVAAHRAALLAEQAEADKPYDGMCYWLKNGQVYHITRDCTYIKGKENVLSGMVEDATQAGKARVCSACGDGA